MKNLKKAFVIVTMVALLVLAAMTCAMADEKIYTSPAFKLPKERIQAWVDTLEDEEAPTEEEAAALPAEGEEAPAEEGTAPAEGEQAPAEEGTVPAEGEQAPEEEGTVPAEGEQAPAEGRPAEEGTPAEGTEEPAEGAEAAEPAESEESAEPVRKVRIFSSQGDVVTEGEIIYLTSELEGFDGLEITYQWQVDKGDGNGWVNVEGANRPKHMFVANRETIQYSWRLIVNVNE